MHVEQNTCSHGRMRSVFLSKQIQHSKADSSSGLSSVTLANKFGKLCRRAYTKKKKISTLNCQCQCHLLKRPCKSAHPIMLFFTR